MTPEESIAKEIYAALNRNDIPEIFTHFDPHIERTEPDNSVYRGQEDVKAHFIKARDTWAEGSCEPEKFFISNDKVVVFVHVNVRLKNKTEWNEGLIADGFTFRNRKVTQFRTFIDRQEALNWAGL